jgi:hypothetical protein
MPWAIFLKFFPNSKSSWINAGSAEKTLSMLL